jgi:hypothetical protein
MPTHPGKNKMRVKTLGLGVVTARDRDGGMFIFYFPTNES